MHHHLLAFISDRCIQFPSARIPMVEFLRFFRTILPAKARQSWRRGRVVAELSQAGFLVVIDDDKKMHIGGLTIRGHWADGNGRLLVEPSNVPQ